MKKLITIMCMAVLSSLSYAQDKGKTYLNLNYSSAKISQPNTGKISNDFGAGLTVGHNYFLHKVPVAKILRFGIDATWFDINYNKFSYKRGYGYTYDYYDDDYYGSYYDDASDEALHQGEVGMQVGPSLTITPVNRLNIKTYFKYAPSCGILYDTGSGDVSCNFASMFVGGMSVIYGVIGMGIEARFGSSKQKEYTFIKHGAKGDEKVSTSVSGMRFYISIAF